MANIPLTPYDAPGFERRNTGSKRQPFTGFSAEQLNIGSSGMNLLSTYYQTQTNKEMAGFEKFTSEQQARLLLRNANARYAAGTRQAGEIAHKGRRAESDAVAAMISQGGTTDPELLAKLNLHTTHAALAAVFQGTVESGSMRLQAQAIKGAGAMNYANARVSSANARLSSMINFSKTLMGSFK